MTTSHGSEEDARERFLACIGIDWYGAATYILPPWSSCSSFCAISAVVCCWYLEINDTIISPNSTISMKTM